MQGHAVSQGLHAVWHEQAAGVGSQDVHSGAAHEARAGTPQPQLPHGSPVQRVPGPNGLYTHPQFAHPVLRRHSPAISNIASVRFMTQGISCGNDRPVCPGNRVTGIYRMRWFTCPSWLRASPYYIGRKVIEIEKIRRIGKTFPKSPIHPVCDYFVSEEICPWELVQPAPRKERGKGTLIGEEGPGWNSGTGAVGDIAPHMWSPTCWRLELTLPKTTGIGLARFQPLESIPESDLIRNLLTGSLR